MFGKDKKVNDFVNTWWWKVLRVFFLAVVSVFYIFHTISWVEQAATIIAGVILFLLLTSFFASAVLILRTIIFFVAEKGSERTKKSFKSSLLALFVFAAMLGVLLYMDNDPDLSNKHFKTWIDPVQLHPDNIN